MTSLVERREAVLGPESLLSYDEPIEMVAGAGAWLEGVGGEQFLDAYNNVPHVGHCHPHVVRRGAEQLARLNIHSRYLHAGVTAYAERLCGLFPRAFDRVLFACTGTEANETALRIARHKTGAHGVIVSSVNYHGNSTTLAALTTAMPSGELFPDWARTVDITLARQPEAFAEELDRAASSLEAAGHGVCALLVDTIFSFEGLPDIPEGAFQQAIAVLRQRGGLFIADEVQAGFGRTGSAMWGWSWLGPQPDLVTLGKPMANGYPMSAIVGRADLLDPFLAAAVYFNTFAASPVAAAMADAVLDVIEDEKLIDRAREVGERLHAGLAAAIRDQPASLTTVRGRGLYVGLETRDGDTGRFYMEGLRRRRVLVGRTGVDGAVIKIRPPLCFGVAEADHLIAMVRDTARELEEMRGGSSLAGRLGPMAQP